MEIKINVFYNNCSGKFPLEIVCENIKILKIFKKSFEFKIYLKKVDSKFFKKWHIPANCDFY